MKPNLENLIRTLQSELYFLKEAKDTFYYFGRKVLRRPSDRDFNALRFIPDDVTGCYLDIGANQGQSIEAITLFKPQARVYSFEANRSLAEKLIRRYAKRDRITVRPYGLADEVQCRTLYVPVYRRFVYDGLASFDKESAARWLSPKTLYWFSPTELTLQETLSSTERLDDQALDPIFIKIDVQGYEYQVVKGGIETIKRCEPILMIEDFLSHQNLVHLVHGLGYEQYLLDDSGFYRADSSDVMNALLMTPRRASLVTRSKQHSGV